MLASVVSMRVVKKGRPAAPLWVSDTCETMAMVVSEAMLRNMRGKKKYMTGMFC